MVAQPERRRAARPAQEALAEREAEAEAQNYR
jgi:hypothetical protein